MFPAPPALCFHKSRPGGAPAENGQVLVHPLSRSVHPCPQLFLLLLLLRLILVLSNPTSFSSSSFSSSFSLPRPPSRHLACVRSPLSAFLCGFAVLFRRIFFPSRFAQRHPSRCLRAPARASAFTFRLPGVITASCGLLAVCRRGLQVVPRGNRS